MAISDSLQLVDLSEEHISEIIPLEGLIRQYARNVYGDEFKVSLLKQFIAWHQEELAYCKVLIEPNQRVIAYFLLITNDELIDQFFYHPQERNSNCSYLAQIAVHEEYQGQGLGLDLMKLIHDRSLQLGRRRLVLEVHSQSKAYMWYKSLGFEEICSQVFLGMNLKN